MKKQPYSLQNPHTKPMVCSLKLASIKRLEKGEKKRKKKKAAIKPLNNLKYFLT